MRPALLRGGPHGLAGRTRVGALHGRGIVHFDTCRVGCLLEKFGFFSSGEDLGDGPLLPHHDQHHDRHEAEVVTRVHERIQFGEEAGKDVPEEAGRQEHRREPALQVGRGEVVGHLQADCADAQLGGSDDDRADADPAERRLAVDGGQVTGHRHREHAERGDGVADHDLCQGGADVELRPDRGDERGEADDHDRVQVLAHLWIQAIELAVLAGEQDPGARVLVVDHPEARHQAEQPAEAEQGLTILGDLCGGAGLGAPLAAELGLRGGVVFLAECEQDHGQHHHERGAYEGHLEAVGDAVVLGEVGPDQWDRRHGQQAADVDRAVVPVEGLALEFLALVVVQVRQLLVVEFAHQGGGVRLDRPGTDGQEDEGDGETHVVLGVP